MSDVKYAPVCGSYCGSCSFLGRECTGCGYVEGRPFWVSSAGMEVCPLHDCCRNRKGLEHCGLCEEVPCRIFLELRDPNMSDEEFRQSLEARQQALARRAQVGTEQWLVARGSLPPEC